MYEAKGGEKMKTNRILLCLLGTIVVMSCGCIDMDTNPLDTDYAVSYSCLTQSGTQYFETRGEASNFANNKNRYGTCDIVIREVGDMM